MLIRPASTILSGGRTHDPAGGDDHLAEGTDHRDAALGDVDQGLTVPRVGRVQIDQTPDPLGGPVGDAGDHHPAVAVSDKDHVVEVFVVQHRGDVGDVQIEINPGPQQVRPLTHAGQRDRVRVVASLSQHRGNPLIAPPAVRPAGHQNIRRHGTPP